MAKRVLILIVMLLQARHGLFATNFYFSSSKGNDNYSLQQAQNKSTPWKSLEKLKSVMPLLKAGDSVLFLRGDVFVGTISVVVSGKESKPVCFAAYGNKTKHPPEINGRITLGGWTKFSNNIWITDGADLSNKVNYFTINGKAYPMGRYPNADETPDGYLHLESADSSLSITDEDLPPAANWTGAELVIKPRRWLVDRNLITKHEGKTIWYNSFSRYIPRRGFGYFIQHHLKTLDRFGEWYFDSSSKKIYLYLGNETPLKYNIQASHFDILCDINKQSYINISGINFIGANENAISINDANHIVVRNCTMMYAGQNGIQGAGNSNVLIENNQVQDVNNTGLYFIRNCHNTVIRNNKIKRCGIIDGAGPSGNGKTEGLSIGGNNNLVEYNVIDSIGYIALFFAGNDVLVKNNVISNFTMNKDDGGGIYVISGKRQGPEFRNRKIIGNIVTNGIGNGSGTPNPEVRSAIGIYMDDGTNNVDIFDNLVGNCAEIGIFLHDARFINVRNNLSYNCGIPFAMHQDLIWNGGSMHDNAILNNIFVSSMQRPLLESFRTQENNVVNFGKLDSNYFWSPSASPDQKQLLFKEVIERSKELRYSISEWRSKYSYEHGSSFSEIAVQQFEKKILIKYNDSKKIMTVQLGNEKYEDVKGKQYTGEIQIQPYQWLFLVKSGKS